MFSIINDQSRNVLMLTVFFVLKSHAIYITKNWHTCMFMPIIYYHQYNKLASYDWRLKRRNITDATFLNADCTFQFIYRIAKLQDKIDVSSRGKGNFCVFPWIYQFFSIIENFWKDLPLLKMSTHNPFIYDCVQEITKPFDSY